MSVASLTFHSFIRHNILRPHDDRLSKKDRCTALALSILFGILTAGLCHLIVRIALYQRNFSHIGLATNASVVAHQLLLSGKNFPRLFDGGNLAKKCDPKDTLDSIFEAHNKKHVDECLLVDVTALGNVLKSRKDKLSKNERDWVDQSVGSWKNQQVTVALRNFLLNYSQEQQELAFWQQQLRHFKRGQPSEYSVVHVGCGPTVINPIWYHMMGLFSTRSNDIQRLLDTPLPDLMPGNALQWESSAKTFSKKMRLDDLRDEEYALIKQYFNDRVKILNQEIQLSERKMLLGDAWKSVTLNALNMPMEKSHLRAALLMPNEINALTVNDLKNVSEIELKGILARLQHLPPSHHKLPDNQISVSNIDQLYIRQLHELNGKKLEEILPALPTELFCFVTNINELSIGALQTHFDPLFPKCKFGDKMQSARIKCLTTDQVNALLDKFDAQKFSNLSDQQVAGVDINLIRLHFDTLFPPPPGMPGVPADSYQKLTVDMVNQLIDKFDDQRLGCIDFDIIMGLDVSKLSSVQKATINSFQIPGFTV